MEKRDELWPHGPCFYYDTALFPPGTDSFCLAYFARPSRGDTVCDLGSGIGLLGTLLLARQESLFIENVELSAPAAALARKTFAENGWADRAAFHEGDLRDVSVLPKAGSVDYVISNPPYFPAGSGESAKGEARQIAREETSCTLDDVCAAAQRVLRYGGRFTLVHRAERLADVLCAMRSHGIEQKRPCHRAAARPQRRGVGRRVFPKMKKAALFSRPNSFIILKCRMNCKHFLPVFE